MKRSVRRALPALLFILFFILSAGAVSVRAEDLPSEGGEGVYTSVDQLEGKQGSAAPEEDLRVSSFNGKRAGVITGSFHDSVLAEKLPDSPISEFNTYTDEIAALKTDRIDYFLVSRATAAHLTEADDSLMVLAEPVKSVDIGAVFAKTEEGTALKAQMDEFISKLREDGTLDEIHRFWSDPSNEGTAVDLSGLRAENGILRFATSGTKVPVSYVADGQIAGSDPDIAARFCRAYGYGMDVSIVDVSGIIPGIVTGMYDFSLTDMVITEERKESVLFSLPYNASDLLLLTRRAGAAGAVDGNAEDGGLSGQFADSFKKTFLREERWKLFARGMSTTLFITILAVLSGTALGFAVFMLCRSGNRVTNGITRVFLSFLKGMPMVVFLMVLYYIVFGRLSLDGDVVAVIAFTLTFGGSVFGLLRMGVGTVDAGQYEAARALGYSDLRAFFRIILPQAVPLIMPSYKGEITGLIKATSIVGYIAVQDLTKMGDIVRSRTYEAFFPLIAVTVIYFALEALLLSLVSQVEKRVIKRNRKRQGILKGVRRSDAV